jgi:diguanylate cyclase (GGDEF)-like protein
VLLPDTDLESAAKVAEEIRAKVEAAQIPYAENNIMTSVTISIGVISILPAADDASREFIMKADERLYLAKTNGRNQVCTGL